MSCLSLCLFFGDSALLSDNLSSIMVDVRDNLSVGAELPFYFGTSAFLSLGATPPPITAAEFYFIRVSLVALLSESLGCTSPCFSGVSLVNVSTRFAVSSSMSVGSL